MNTRSRTEPTDIGFRRLFLVIVVLGLVFALTPYRVYADSNEPTPTATATPVPTSTTEPTQSDAENIVDIPVIENPGDEGAADEVSVDESAIEDGVADENVAPLPPPNEETGAPSSLFQSVSGVNRCLIGAIVLGLIAITIMVLYNVVQRIRT
jgi:hypothetical protein